MNFEIQGLLEDNKLELGMKAPCFEGLLEVSFCACVFVSVCVCVHFLFQFFEGHLVWRLFRISIKLEISSVWGFDRFQS